MSSQYPSTPGRDNRQSRATPVSSPRLTGRQCPKFGSAPSVSREPFASVPHGRAGSNPNPATTGSVWIRVTKQPNDGCRASESVQRGPGRAARTAPGSGRTCRSCGDRAGSAEPRTECPSLSLAHASLLARQPVAGSLPAPYRRAAHLRRRLIWAFRSDGRQRTARQRGPGQGRQPQLIWTAPSVREASARDVTLERYTPRSKPARFDPNLGPRLLRWGLLALALESGSRRGCDGGDRSIY